MLIALLLAQAAVDLKPSFQKFDRLQSACTIKTKVTSSNGRDSDYTVTLELVAEAETSDAAGTTFDCGVSKLRIEGTLDGRKVSLDWIKGSGWKGEGKVAGVDRSLEKGWKMTLAPGKGTSVGDAYLELGDLLPVLNPGALLGYPVPPPAEPVAVEKGWPGKPVTYGHAEGGGLLRLLGRGGGEAVGGAGLRPGGDGGAGGRGGEREGQRPGLDGDGLEDEAAAQGGLLGAAVDVPGRPQARDLPGRRIRDEVAGREPGT
jgi:hypothetical protein